MKFRDYQKKIIDLGTEVIRDKGVLYLAMEVRTGKTLTALGICEMLTTNNVLFITKKKAISSINYDYHMLSPDFNIEVINYESLHKHTMTDVDMMICDEAHSMGAFARPSKRAKMVKELLIKYHCPLMLLSGTPTPESFSQIYHQLYGHPRNPFYSYKNFYSWANDYVRVTQKMISGNRINDYSNGIESKIKLAIQPYLITYTQKDAGFQTVIDEEILEVQMSPLTYRLCTQLKKDLVIKGKDQLLLADTGVKLMQKLHQLYSGTVIFESGDSKVLDTTKARFIKSKFRNSKIAIFYKFKAELTALQEAYEGELTTDLQEFKDTYKHIALQIVSGREGISLQEADYLVYYNIDFSATSYWQSRDRMSTQTRLNNKIYWIFSNNGIEKRIYKAVNGKKNYTLSHFKKDLLSL